MTHRIRKAMAQKEQGFTLIELLVVIIIIGILAAIAIPIFLSQRKKGVDASMKSDLKNAATSAESYLTDNPTATGPGATTAANTGAGYTNLTGAGFKPSSGNQFTVKTITAGYCIQVTNTSGSKVTAMSYDSNNGGFKGYDYVAAGTPCA